MRPTYFVYASERGNLFMREIAALVAATLEDLGYTTVFPAQGLPEQGRDRINLVVAPHEFFALWLGAGEVDLIRAAQASVSLGVEQPGTTWFELGTHYASAGPIVLDINSYAVAELESRGLDAVHVQLGYHPSWDRWHGDPDHPRPTDVLFMGSVAHRRGEVLGEAAPMLWDCASDFRIFEFPRPMSRPRNRFVIGEEKWELLASSKVLLNVHRSEVPYFEWVRALDAIVNGCVVVTETSSDYGPLEVGEHLVAGSADVVGAYAGSLLLDPDLRNELATNAYDYVRTKLEMSALLAPVCARVEQAVAAPARHAIAVVQPPPAAGPINAELDAAVDTERQVNARLKQLLDSETHLVQRVEALQSRLQYGTSHHLELATTRSWDGFAPDVSVVVTSYNYASFIEGALRSVVVTTGLDVELVVVDDHSQDESLDVVDAFMEETPWFPTCRIAKAANAGVGQARHDGIEVARADLVFVLDADNRVYPTALAKLAAALEDDPDAAFAYGIIGQEGAPGLLSYLPWDTERLTKGNYIDAMAMVRRRTFDEVGGYDQEFSLLGLEDFEFWLRLASHGRHGAFVPQIVGTYRVHTTSRQHMVNLEAEPLLARMRMLHPNLPWESESW